MNVGLISGQIFNCVQLHPPVAYSAERIEPSTIETQALNADLIALLDQTRMEQP
jgi:hypothetical protein